LRRNFAREGQEGNKMDKEITPVLQMLIDEFVKFLKETPEALKIYKEIADNYDACEGKISPPSVSYKQDATGIIKALKERWQ